MRIFNLAASIVLVALLPLASPVSLAAPDKSPAISTSLFSEVEEEVKANYVEPVTDTQLVEGAIKGMLSALDPHSNYMDAKEYSEMMVQTRGEFGGLGMQVTMENGIVKVVSPIDDTPAALAGMKPDDLILAIDNVPVTDMTLSEAVEKLRGPVGTTVTLMVRREGVDPFQIKLTRADIKVDPVKSHLVGGDIGYVRISSFSERTDTALVSAITAMKSQSGNKLIGIVLDLRNNPGGLLDQAVAVSNSFLDGGGIVSIKGRQAQDNRRYDAQPGRDLVRGLPVVVLINGGSASASEIVAGALHDDHRAVLLGTRSFGKGSVQTVLPVKESGGAIRLTTALYFTPSGRSIQAKGIEPDVVVEPAKIEKIETGALQREADLPGALPNTGPASATPADAAKPAPAPGPTSQNAAPAAPTPSARASVAVPATRTPNVPPGTTPVPTTNALDANTMGTDADYQLVRAVDLLRGVSLFKTLAAQ